MKSAVEAPDWSSIPAPLDDGAARHLAGARMASVLLRATNGDTVDLSAIPGRVVVYAYPRTGKPGVANPDGWDMIPGAWGCTPQSCSFRDHFAELKALGVGHLFGLSTQDPDYQREAVERLHLSFAILSDEHLKLTRAMNLPTRWDTFSTRCSRRIGARATWLTWEHIGFSGDFPETCRRHRRRRPLNLGRGRMAA